MAPEEENAGLAFPPAQPAASPQEGGEGDAGGCAPATPGSSPTLLADAGEDAPATRGSSPTLLSVRLQLLAGHSDLSQAFGDDKSASEVMAEALRERGGGCLRPGGRFRVREDVHVAVVCTDPPDGGLFEPCSSQVVVEPERLPVFRRVHILPFKDAAPADRACTITEYIRPFFEQCGARPIMVEFEFGYAGCRFQVIGCDPPGPALVGPTTDVFWQGPAIERFLARRISVLPYSHTLPSPTLGAAPADLLADYVRPYFDQRSAPLRAGDEFETRGVRFRVTHCEPPGTGPAAGTEVLVNGQPLTECSWEGCSSLAIRRCSEPCCGRLLCSRHAVIGATAVACADHAQGRCRVM